MMVNSIVLLLKFAGYFVVTKFSIGMKFESLVELVFLKWDMLNSYIVLLTYILPRYGEYILGDGEDICRMGYSSKRRIIV